MNKAEEDALIREHQLRSGDPVEQRIRLAIREAVAQERERCAKVADKHAKRDFTWGSENSDRYHAQADWAAKIAAAIRRGE